MNIHPIVSALRRHKAGTFLIALQIAFTLTIVCNALFIIRARFDRMGRPSGLIENNLLFIASTHTGLKDSIDADNASIDASIKADLSALRELPDVVDAYETNSMPLSGITSTLGLKLKQDAGNGAPTAIYNADDHTLSTLGVRLIAGRNFLANEITGGSPLGVLQPPVIIVSKLLANRLFPDGGALGKQVYFTGANTPSTIVGIVERLQTGATDSTKESRTWNSTLIPQRLIDPSRYYVVRTKPGRELAAILSVPAALYAQDPQRFIPDGLAGSDAGVRRFAQIRAEAYQGDRALALIMGVICIILLSVTGAGIAGLSSFWVGQRRRQIGVRRALGATRHDIISYFLIENALISGAGAVVGVFLALEFNDRLIKRFELMRLPLTYVLAGAVVLIILSQAAALAPALRASRITLAEAIRS